MKRKWILTGVLICLPALFGLQLRFWREFDWRTFCLQTSQAKIAPIASAVALIYLAYMILAWRWKIFLFPFRRSSLARLFPPTAIGFTGLVLLGRPGDLIRPYLIARNEKVSFSSQVAIWVVERLFDLLAAALLITISLLAKPAWDSGVYVGKLRVAGAILLAVVLGLLAAIFLLRGQVRTLAGWVRSECRRFNGDLGERLAGKIETFEKGLSTVDSVSSFLKVTSLSLVLWSLNALAYWLVIRAYPEPLHHFGITQAAVLMGFGIVGSAIQLPAVGGGAQLMTVAALVKVFQVPKELAVSCGITLWLVSFASIIPVGLALGRREDLFQHRFSQASETTSPQPFPATD
jgi:glycosyltransferase 2 family protein